jgi:HK97 family phage portal protein
MLLDGESYAEQKRIAGRLVALDFLPFRTVSWTVNLATGDRDWHYIDLAGRRRDIDPKNLFRTIGLTKDGRNGLSPISYGASIFYSALMADTAANGTFQRGLMPTVAVKLKEWLKKDQREELRDNFEKKVGGALRAGKPVVLEGGAEVQSIGINPKDAQLLESRSWSIEEVCRWFGVPPDMVGHTSKASSWGTGVEQRMLGFLMFTLRPWLTRIEKSVQRSLFAPGERQRYFIKFSVEELLRADSAARAAFLSLMVNNGLMTRDEARISENLPPMGGNAAVLTVQSALQPIDSLGQAADAADTAGNALKAWLDALGEKHHASQE